MLKEEIDDIVLLNKWMEETELFTRAEIIDVLAMQYEVAPEYIELITDDRL